MNIKIVYNNRTHKLTNKAQTLNQIREATTNLYPDTLKQGFDLYITINPEFPPVKIMDDQHYERVKDVYKNMEWASLKFLVKDSQNPNLTEQDICLLNQSIIIRKDQKLPQLADVLQQTQQIQEIKQEKEQPQQLEKQLKIEKEIMKSIQRANSEITQLDYKSKEFTDLVNQIVDQKLAEYGFIKLPQNPIDLNYKATIISVSQPKFKANFKEQFQWYVNIGNGSNFTWQPGHIGLCCLSGVFAKTIIPVQAEVQSGQIGMFNHVFRAPEQEIKESVEEFRLINLDNNTYFGPKCGFQLSITKPNLQKELGISQKDIKLNLEFELKLKQFLEVIKIPENQAKEFLQLFNPSYTAQQLIEIYIDQN